MITDKGQGTEDGRQTRSGDSERLPDSNGAGAGRESGRSDGGSAAERASWRPAPRTKKRAWGRWLLTLCVLLAAVGAVLYYRSPAGRRLADRTVAVAAERAAASTGSLWGAKADETTFVPTTVVRRGGFDVSLIAVGALRAEQSEMVVVDTSGTVVWIVEDGTRVKKGDRILELQNNMLTLRLEEKATELANARQKLADTHRDRQLEWQNATTQYQKAQQELQILEAQNKAAVEQAEAQLEFQNTELALARVEYAKNQRLAEENLVPRIKVEADAAAVKAKEYAYEKAKGDLELQKRKLASDELQKRQEVRRLQFAADVAKNRIESEVRNAQLNVDTIQKQREDLVDQIKKSVVRAPSDGIVVLTTRREDGNLRPLQVGDQVGRNEQVCELPDLSRMQVVLEVEQKDIGPIRVGLPVRIRLDPFPDQFYTGRVVEVAAVAKPSEIDGSRWDANKNTFTTIIDVNESDPGRLRPGMSATLEIYSNRLENVTYIPLEALFQQDDKPVAYLKESERFRRVPLEVGTRNKDKIIVKKGLKPGQQIALVPPPSGLILNSTSPPAGQPAAAPPLTDLSRR